jgi:hypothetical protein
VVAAALIAAAIAVIFGGLTLNAGLQRLRAAEHVRRANAAHFEIGDAEASRRAKGD